jgi:glycosyltransferase involved in cell wall biosynthesis
VYRIGYWYWELEDVPEIWQKPAASLQELWAPTEFIATAFRKAFSTKVTGMLPGVSVGRVEPINRAEFGIGKDDFLFLFMFDMKSYMERKNPLGLIKAFQQAFRPDDRVKLMIKVSDGRMNLPEQARLKEAAKNAGVVLVDQVLTRGKSYGLIHACDCYVSLHRSEGLGLTMAEAMLMAKPVIATGYSGNLDFMKPSNSMLVEHQLMQIGGSCPEYVHQVYKEYAYWADPSTEHAAARMRWVFEHRDDARALGLLGRAHAEDVLSPQAASQRMKARLEEIYQEIRQVDKTPAYESAA